MITKRLRYIEQLASGIAHEYNNYLTVLQGNLCLLRVELEPLQPPVAEKLQKIVADCEHAVGRADELTRKLLNFTKGPNRVRKPVSVRKVVEDAMNFALSGSNSKCEFVVKESPWLASIDVGQISRAFINLAIEADSNMAEGGTIEVTVENETVPPDNGSGGGNLAPGDYVKISITDAGAGYSPEELENIFDPYVLAQDQAPRWGIAQAYAIVKKHDGKIRAHSELNHGATFEIYLPAAAGLTATVEDTSPADQIVPGHGRVLFMDDQAIVRKVAGRLLKNLGYSIYFARDGEELLAAYERASAARQPFDAVIMDLTVPGGLNAEKVVKNLLGMDPDARVIVSSGYATHPMVIEYEKFGFRGALSKPYSMKRLGELLHDVLEA